jgi:hypothetical protein
VSDEEDMVTFLRHLDMCPRPPWKADIDRLVSEFYALEGNTVGGSLHVVLDDCNWERHHVEYAKGYAAEKGDVAGERFASLLLELTDQQLQEYLGPERCWVCHGEVGVDGHTKMFDTPKGECPQCGSLPGDAT